jgi:hypothetical protein
MASASLLALCVTAAAYCFCFMHTQLHAHSASCMKHDQWVGAVPSLMRRTMGLDQKDAQRVIAYLLWRRKQLLVWA